MEYREKATKKSFVVIVVAFVIDIHQSILIGMYGKIDEKEIVIGKAEET